MADEVVSNTPRFKVMNVENTQFSVSQWGLPGLIQALYLPNDATCIEHRQQKVFLTRSSGETIRSKCFLFLCTPPFFNLETAVGNSNNCRLAVGGFLRGVRLQRKRFQAVPLQMFLFPKARSLCFIVFAAPVLPLVLRLFWGTICVLGPGFICWCLAKGRRGRQMKPINHLTGYKR